MFKFETMVRSVVRSGAIAALGASVIVGSGVLAAGATAATPQSATLGSTAGNPNANICAATINCTYVPFNGVSAPQLQVPFDGTVTTFSVNAGSAGGSVELRVLRPAGGGRYTGAGTSPPETLSTGLNTFTVSLPVKAGDVLGLDNDSSALMFDVTNQTSIAAYYELPPLADGATAAPNHNQGGYRLLLSATVEPTTTSSTTPPRITGARETHRVWRAAGRPSHTRAHRAPVGTTFSFRLNEPALVNFAFTRHVRGRRTNVSAGALQVRAHAGLNEVRFQGRVGRLQTLAPGAYTVRISATNPTGQRSNVASLTFTIVR